MNSTERIAALDGLKGQLLAMLTFAGYEINRHGKACNWLEAATWTAVAGAAMKARIYLEQQGIEALAPDAWPSFDGHLDTLSKWAGKYPRWKTKYERLKWTWLQLTERTYVHTVRRGRRASTAGGGEPEPPAVPQAGNADAGPATRP